MKPEYAHDLPPESACCITEQGSTRSKTFSKWIHHFVKYKPMGLCLVLFDRAESHLDLISLQQQNKMIFYSIICQHTLLTNSNL